MCSCWRWQRCSGSRWGVGCGPSGSRLCCRRSGRGAAWHWASEVIGLPDGSIGDALYRAKITLSTGELFAWTFVIILLSAVFEKLFLALLDRAVARVLGEEGV